MSNELMVLPEAAKLRGIDLALWSALKNSIYPGARDESVLMAHDYCKARSLDPLLKPVHLVPMSVKMDGQKKPNGDDVYEYRDVVMPGVGLYRIQADRSGTYAGMDAPKFGDEIEAEFGKGDAVVAITFPEWCEVTVWKLIGDRLVAFTAREYWIENYATAGKGTNVPNSMWKKRPRGQIVKCTEAQALRKAWPEVGQAPTAEEMEGKHMAVDFIEGELAGDKKSAITMPQEAPAGIAIEGEKAEVKQDVKFEPLTAGMLKQLRNSLKATRKIESELCAVFGVETMEQISRSQINNALKFARGES